MSSAVDVNSSRVWNNLMVISPGRCFKALGVDYSPNVKGVYDNKVTKKTRVCTAIAHSSHGLALQQQWSM